MNKDFLYYHLVYFFMMAGAIVAHIYISVIGVRTGSRIWGELFTDYDGPMIFVYLFSLVLAWAKTYDERDSE